MASFDHNIAIDLCNHGLILFDQTGEGKWKIKIHDAHPGAPLQPYYTNLRNLRSLPILHDRVADAYVKMIRESGIILHRLSDVPQAITPTAGLISVKTGLPMISPRLGAKAHGIQRAIEGLWEPGDRVGVIDDVRTTGASKEEVGIHLQNQGLEIAAFFVLIDYDPLRAPVMGRPVIAKYQWQDFLAFCRERRILSDQGYAAATSYPKRLREYIERRKVAGSPLL